MKQMVLFTNIKYKEILDDILEGKVEGLSKLINFGLNHGFTGNLWHIYLAYIIAYNENPFAISCENNGDVLGNLDIVKYDLSTFMDYFKMDLSKIESGLVKDIYDFKMKRENYVHFDNDIIGLITSLALDLANADDLDKFMALVINFYKNNGVGDLGFHKAFRIDDDGNLIPVKNVMHVEFDDLIGYEWQKERLIHNTKTFVEGKEANNVLLYGDSGTGKSTSIKAVLNMFYNQGLRMIEVYKHQMSDVANLIATFKKRHYKFIIYMDDLSFEENEVEYKHLKSIIEGGLEAKPQNVLVYCTSNRRHLIKETFADNGDINDDLHRNETMAEKLSLVARFGLQILFMSPDNTEFKKIVTSLAKKYKIVMDEATLLNKATQWEIRYGNLSGRTAEQFVKFIASGEEL